MKFADNLSDRFLKDKEKYHFILITSETEYFTEYEKNYYKEKMSEKDKKKMLYGLQTKIIKEIDMKSVKNSVKKDKGKRLTLKLKEYDNIKKLISNFVAKDYCYISYSLGGFKEIHEQSLKFHIPLLNHDDNCYICVKNKKKKQKVGFFSKFFKSDVKRSKLIKFNIIRKHFQQELRD